MSADTIDLTQLRALLDQKQRLVLLDTGLAEDYAVAHLPSAQNACVFEVSFLDQVNALPGIPPSGSSPSPQGPLIVTYGASEHSLASTTAAGKLRAAGFRSVRDYRGGLAQWQAAGLPTEGHGPANLPPPLENRAYRVDPAQSSVEWVGRSLGGRHQGTLTLLPGGTVTLQDGRAVGGSFRVDMTSINDTDLTDSALKKVLHHHLASDDFFEVAKYPEASFQLDGAEEIPGATLSDPNYRVHGRFTLKDVEKPLRFDAQIGRSPAGDGALVARANFDFDRTEWNVLYGSGKFYEKLGKHLVSDLITLDLKIVAV